MTLGAYYVEAQRLSWRRPTPSLPVGILIALVLYVNEVPDRRRDALAGKRTLPVRLSRDAIVFGYAGAVTVALALIVIGAASGVMARPSLVAVAAAPLARSVYRGLRACYDDPYALEPVMAQNIQLHLVTGLLLIAGYLVALLAR